MENATNGRSLMHHSGATKDKVVGKEKGVDGGQLGPRVIPKRLELWSSL